MKKCPDTRTAVGAPGAWKDPAYRVSDDDGDSVRGAVWILFLDGGGAADCTWDLNGDDVVGTGDLILLLGSWGAPYGTADLIELLGAWGPCP